jgi:hypothetical protein
VRIQLLADGPAGVGGNVAFSNLNTNLPSVPWCPADSLTDTFPMFPGPTSANSWLNSQSGNGCTIAMSNGAVITNSLPTTDCWHGTSTAYDLTSSAVIVNVSAPSQSDSTWKIRLEAINDAGQVAAIEKTGAQICAKTNMGGIGNCYTDLSNTNNLYWKIRGTPTGLELETSTDANSWTVLGTLSPSQFDAHAVAMRLRSQTVSASAGTTYTVKFLTYN